MTPAACAWTVSARVDLLIERRHGGDRGAAARALGIAPEGLAGMLSGDWREFTLDAIAALVLGHGVTVPWLLGLDACAATLRDTSPSGASHASDHPTLSRPHG
jgi:hypothetical protein